MDSPSAVAQKSLGVEIEGRNYTGAAHNRLSPDVEAPSFPLMERIERRMLESMPIIAPTLRQTDLMELVNRYSESLALLHAAREQTIRFFDATCRSNMEFRADSEVHYEQDKQALEREHARSMDKLALPPLPSSEACGAALANMSLEYAEAKLRCEIESFTKVFVRMFFDCCDRLVNERVLGLVRWLNSNACVLFFFRKVIIRQLRQSATVTTEESRLNYKSLMAPGWTRGTPHGEELIRTEQEEHVTGEHEFRLARHEHELLQANSVPLDTTVTPIPQAFQPVVEMVPDWLRPEMRLITGVQISGQVLEIELHRDTWSEVRQLPAVQEWRPVMEPAVCLGHYVFTGWGELEMSAENDRTEREMKLAAESEAVALAQSISRQRVWMFATIQFTAVVMTVVGAIWAPASMKVGLALALLGVWPAVDWLRRYHTAGGKSASPASVMTVGATLGLLAAAVHLSLATALTASWPTAVISIFFCVCACSFGWLLVRSGGRKN